MQQWNGRMIQEANFGLFRTLITWKANKFRKTLVAIGRFEPTSKVCSSCGRLLELTLKDRWIEFSCGCSLHRDHNAALNILTIGLHRAGMVQIYACGDSDMSSGLWESLKQEAMPFRAWQFTKRPLMKYEQEGRIQTLEEAIEVDNAIKELLKIHHIPYTVIQHTMLMGDLISYIKGLP